MSNTKYILSNVEEMKTGLIKLLNREVDGIDLEVTRNKFSIAFFMKNCDIYRIQYKEDKFARAFISGSLTDFMYATIKKIKAIDNGYEFTTDKGIIKFEYEIDMLDTIDTILEFETVYLRVQDKYVTNNR